jgi:surface protein
VSNLIINPYSFGAAAPDTAFTFTVNTALAGSAADTFVVPLVSNGAIDLVIDWGDSTSDVIIAWNDSDLTHVYAAGAGTYTIRITATTGTLRGWTFGWGGDKVKMTEISQWGDFNWTNSSAFTQCANMVNTATDLPNITGNSMQYGFYGCTLWNPANAGLWDVSSVSNLNSIFIFNSSFNQDLDGWDVSNVTNFGGIFYGTSFNYPLPNWDTGNGTSFNQMFLGTPFNQDVDMWDMSSATSLFSMFSNCTAFNQDLNSWDTSNVTSIWAVFYGCTVFNGNISSWDMSSCTRFDGAFQDCAAFNQNITGWNVSASTNLSYMFRSAVAFNQNISGWNVGNVTTMNSMFFYANTFNQDIGGWSTGNVTDMRSVFRNNAAFDQDLGDWDITSVTQLDAFMNGTTLSTVNYDALLIGWEAQSVVSGLTVDFGPSKYTGGADAAAAHASLIAVPNSWTITDGGIL